MYTYLLLNVGSILFPFLLSFDKKVAFYKNWRALFPAIFFVASIFIIWDIFFTKLGIWHFNPNYVMGIDVINLPVEEWMFFITVPYACVFIYECLIAYVHWEWKDRWNTPIVIALVIVLSTIAILFRDRLYTFVTFTSLAAFYIFLLLRKVPQYMGRFFQAYLIHLIPFFVINGVLTSLPVVIYNDGENLGLRLGTIPVEDTMYSMLLLLLNIHIYEYLKQRFSLTSSH